LEIKKEEIKMGIKSTLIGTKEFYIRVITIVLPMRIGPSVAPGDGSLKKREADSMTKRCSNGN